MSPDRRPIREMVRQWLTSTILPQVESRIEGRVQLLFVEQRNAEQPGSFNVGAMRNAGYLYLRSTYPDVPLESVTLIFHDLDKFPLLPSVYQVTKPGEIQLLCRSPLGGVSSFFAVTAKDFERMKGFPAMWGWVPDELEMTRRAQLCDLKVIPVPSSSIFHGMHPQGPIRVVNGFELYRFVQGVSEMDGLHSMKIESWTEDPANHTLLVDEFSVLVPDSPAHRSVVNILTTPPSLLLQQALQWYEKAYTKEEVAIPPPALLPQPFTFKTPEGVQNIRQFIKQNPRNRMQQLQFGPAPRSVDGI
jgi:hypothetical protein